jgi:AcrR family transcriptional regulator
MAETRRFDEQAVLNIALEVLERRGYREATMVDLAEATGIQRCTLYHAYGDKEELFIRAFANLAVKFYVQAGYALQKPDRRAALQSFFELVVPLDYTARCATVIATRLTTELGDSSERLRGSLAEFFRILEELLCEALSVEGDGTQLSMSPGDAAKLLIATTRGIVVMRDMYLNPAPVMAVIKALLNAVVPSTADEQQIR